MKLRDLFLAGSLGLLAVSCSCGRDREATTRLGDASQDVHAPARPPVPSPDTAPAADPAPPPPRAAERDAAIRAAVGVVQRYLALAGGADWSTADALWAYRRQPAPSEEGGMRALMPARAMQIRNGEPRLLDDEPVPAFLEVPVTLRIDGRDGEHYRYAGWYRLRANPVEQRWELVAASVSAQMR